MVRRRNSCTTPGVSRASAVVLLALVATVGCGNDAGNGPGYLQTNLASNVAGKASFTDPNLVNAWGIARQQTGPWWVVANHTGVTSVYDGQGNPIPTAADPLVVTIPPPADSPPGTASSPTGIVANTTAGFIITDGAVSAPAAFIFSTEDGTIAGWNQTVNPTQAILTVDNSAANAIYKGLAIAIDQTDTFIYASNFHAGTVDVFDRTFTPATLTGSFTDPNLPTGYAPFGVQNINGDLFVTYAKQDANKEDDVKGLGNGYVDVFAADGTLVRRFTSKGQLNSPWGVVQSPISFGAFGGSIIIGNFGDGHVNAFNPIGGTFLGQLNRPTGGSVSIAGLWGLAFGNGSVAGSIDTLYFTAGPSNESGGLFGSLTSVEQ